MAVAGGPSLGLAAETILKRHSRSGGDRVTAVSRQRRPLLVAGDLPGVSGGRADDELAGR
jgi:hypothetical protein